MVSGGHTQRWSSEFRVLAAVLLTCVAPPARRMAGRPPHPDALSLGQDVTAVARLGGVDPAHLPVGSLVGVKRSNGSVTVGRVEMPLPCTPAGYIHVALGEEDRTRKDVPPFQLYSLTSPPDGAVQVQTTGRSARACQCEARSTLGPNLGERGGAASLQCS